MKFFILVFFLTNACEVFGQGVKLQPTETDVLMTVSVVNAEGRPLKDEIIIFTSLSTHSSFSGVPNDSGKFEILLPKNEKFKVKRKNYIDEIGNELIEIPNEEGLIYFDYTLVINPPKVFTMNNVFFDSGLSTLRSEGNEDLDQLIEFLNLKTSIIIEVSGHSDIIEEKRNNTKLSEARAMEVKRYLVYKGIAPERIIPKGYGNKQQVTDNKTEEAKRLNRRIEIKILKE